MFDRLVSRVRLLNRVHAAFGAICLVGLVSVYGHLRSMIDDPVDDIQRSAYDIAEHVGRELQAEKLKLESIAMFLATDGTLDDVQKMARVLMLPLGQNTVLIDRDGKQVFNAQFPLRTSEPFGHVANSVDAVFEHGSTVVSDLYRSAHTGDWRISISTPLVKDSRFQGALSFSWNYLTFEKLINKVSLYPGARWSIADHSGRIMALPFDSTFVGKLRPSSSEDDTSEGDPVWRNSFTGGQAIVAVWAAVPGADWKVHVVIPQAILLARVYAWTLFYAVIYLCLATLLLGFCFSDVDLEGWFRRLPRKVDRLRDQSATTGGGE